MVHSGAVLSSLLLLGAPTLIFGGECCKAHYDIVLSYKKEKWCSNYCCYMLTKYDCCDNFLLQAPSDQRTSVCSAYFRDNEWVSVLIGLGCIALFIGLIVCICRVCCGNCRRQPGVVLGGAANPGVTVVNSSSMMSVGHQPPAYPMQPNPIQQSPPKY